MLEELQSNAEEHTHTHKTKEDLQNICCWKLSATLYGIENKYSVLSKILKERGGEEEQKRKWCIEKALMSVNRLQQVECNLVACLVA